MTTAQVFEPASVRVCAKNRGGQAIRRMSIPRIDVEYFNFILYSWAGSQMIKGATGCCCLAGCALRLMNMAELMLRPCWPLALRS